MRWLHHCDLQLRRGNEAPIIAMTKVVRAIEAAFEGTAKDLALFAGNAANSVADEEHDAVVKEVVAPLRGLSVMTKETWDAIREEHQARCASVMNSSRPRTSICTST